MNFTDMFAYFVSLCVAGLGMLILAWFMRLYWQGRLRRWAKTEGYRLVNFRSARLQEGPQRLRVRRSERLFRISVEDQKLKARRAGWVMYRGFWGLRAPEPATRVIWDEFDD